MAHHEWGDEGVDWAGIGNAAEFLGDYCARWGRFRGQTKEKYGSVRFYAHIGHLSLHSLIFPGYVYCQYPNKLNWLWKAECRIINPILNKLFGRAYVAWQVFIYKRAYKLAIKKWPHLRDEIMGSADHLELLDDCDDLKMNWHPPAFSEKDKKRLGPRLIEYLTEQQKRIGKLQVYEGIVEDLKKDARLNHEELEILERHETD